MYQLGWFSTGRDKAAWDLLQAVQGQIVLGEIETEILFVFCNREPGESEERDAFLGQVDDYHIPLVWFSYRKFGDRQGIPITRQGETLPAWRLEYDREVMNPLQGFHPALSGGPTGTWQEVIWQLIEANAEQTGVMLPLIREKGNGVSKKTSKRVRLI